MSVGRLARRVSSSKQHIYTYTITSGNYNWSTSSHCVRCSPKWALVHCHRSLRRWQEVSTGALLRTSPAAGATQRVHNTATLFHRDDIQRTAQNTRNYCTNTSRIAIAATTTTTKMITTTRTTNGRQQQRPTDRRTTKTKHIRCSLNTSSSSNTISTASGSSHLSSSSNLYAVAVCWLAAALSAAATTATAAASSAAIAVWFSMAHSPHNKQQRTQGLAGACLLLPLLYHRLMERAELPLLLLML